MKIISTIDDTAQAQQYWADWTRRITCGLSTGGCGTVYEAEPSDLVIIRDPNSSWGRYTHNATVNCPTCGRKVHIKAPIAMVRWLYKQRANNEGENADGK